ncbi:MAG: hypothetical protein JO103_09045 [Candidatus Eremiobacteraeota bacterium]|nr:hypothetical protein [Candidatus Eremiobacteraeota bacterium]MBV9407860.1 hypothetical protein [Candidatus Eremiobacteraeota bacterium]
MPTEFRFDDLDLREEPARAETGGDELPTTTVTTIFTHVCTASKLCTRICCTTPVGG